MENSAKKCLAMIEKKKSLYGIKDEAIARFIGISERTYKRRKNHPEEITLGEMEDRKSVV